MRPLWRVVAVLNGHGPGVSVCSARVPACRGSGGLLAYIVLSACTYAHAWWVWEHTRTCEVRGGDRLSEQPGGCVGGGWCEAVYLWCGHLTCHACGSSFCWGADCMRPEGFYVGRHNSRAGGGWRWGERAEASVRGQARVRRCANLLAYEGSGLAEAGGDKHVFKVCGFEPGEAVRENARIWAEVDVYATRHVCKQAEGWRASVEAALMHVGACGLLSSPNMACGKACVPTCVCESLRT